MLSKYGVLYKNYLEEKRPLKYQDLIIDGTINDVIEIKDRELNVMKENIINKLKAKYKEPEKDNFLELARYNNFIYNMADELVKEEIYKILY